MGMFNAHTITVYLDSEAILYKKKQIVLQKILYEKVHL